MKDCVHLDIIPPQQIGAGGFTAEIANCDLKGDPMKRLAMASDAAKILGTLCPPNIECHYFLPDRCEDCPDYLV